MFYNMFAIQKCSIFGLGGIPLCVSWILFREMKLIYSDVKMQEKKQTPGVPGANGQGLFYTVFSVIHVSKDISSGFIILLSQLFQNW